MERHLSTFTAVLRTVLKPALRGRCTHGENLRSLRADQKDKRGRSMQFNLMFFSSREDATSKDKYKLVLEGAKFADQHGFSSVWVPERHFTELGCLYPNPALLHAALARETRNIGLRAGSVVMPLHNPIRVAEEWSVVDNLSGG